MLRHACACLACQYTGTAELDTGHAPPSSLVFAMLLMRETYFECLPLLPQNGMQLVELGKYALHLSVSGIPAAKSTITDGLCLWMRLNEDLFVKGRRGGDPCWQALCKYRGVFRQVS